MPSLTLCHAGILRVRPGTSRTRQHDHLNQAITKMEFPIQHSGHDEAFLAVKSDTSPVGESLTAFKLCL